MVYKINAQQISAYLYNALPKEHKPVNRLYITLPELNNIMINAKWHILKYPKAITELDSMCIQVACRYVDIVDKKQRLLFLYNQTIYWTGRVETYGDSTIKYGLLFKQEISTDNYGFETLEARLAISMGFVYNEQIRDYKKAFQYASNAFSIFKLKKDSAGIFQSGLLLSGIYSQLGLYIKAKSLVDTATMYETQRKNAGIASFKLDFISQLYIKQFVVTHEERFTDSLKLFLSIMNDSVRFSEITNKYTQNAIYFYKAQLAYLTGKYHQCILYLDTATTVLENVVIISSDDALFKIFRGLILVNLGREAEGIAILDHIKLFMDEYYTGMVF